MSKISSEGHHYNPQLGGWAPNFRKETRQTDNLSDAAARAMQTIRQAITEAPADEALQTVLGRFMRAWAKYESSEDKSRAAKEFGAEIDALVHERQMARSLRSSLAKSYTGFEFWNRR
jgi:enolase